LFDLVENAQNAEGSDYDCLFDVVFDCHSHGLSSFADDHGTAVGIIVVVALAASH
jgi:hypothetical protein